MNALSAERPADALSLRTLTMGDALVIVLLPGLFHVTLTGPLTFHDQDTLFQGLGSTDGKIGNQVVTLVLLLIGVMRCGKTGMPLSRAFAIALPFVPFLVWALLSIAWSEHPGLSLRRSGRLVIEMTGVICLALSYANEPERLLRLLLYVCLGIVIVDVALLPLGSSSWSPIGYVGLHYHKQYTGRFLFIAIAVFIAVIVWASARADRRLGWLGLAIGLTLLPLTQAKTIWVALPVALAVAAFVLGLARADLQKAALAAACFGACAAIAGALAFGFAIDASLERTFGDATLTGRDQIWRFALSRLDGHELFGVGYGALWQTGSEIVDRLRQEHRIYVVNEAHNGYIDVLVQTGVIGLSCLGAALLVMFVCLVRDVALISSVGRATAFLSLVLFVGMMIVNLTDSTMFQTYTSLWIEPIAFYALTRALAFRERDPSPAHLAP